MTHTSRLFYSGLMGSNEYANTGGGHNFQCLSHNPQYVNYVDGYQYSAAGGGLMMGTEYRGDPDSIFDMDNLDDWTFLYNDAPCAVCHVENQTSVIMIPAQSQCELGWTEQYWGYLVSEDYYGPGDDFHIIHRLTYHQHIQILPGFSENKPWACSRKIAPLGHILFSYFVHAKWGLIIGKTC